MEAYRRGCVFDGWEECFRYDVWMQTFADLGIDPHFYCNRAIGLDEVTPWAHMDYGITHKYLVREYKKALAAQTTPPCNRACSGCGANRLLGGPVKTEAEAPDFAAWQASLNAIMPAGIRVFRVEPARDKASAIAFACYTIRYPAAAAGCLAGYNALDAAPVEKKGKKGSKQVDLKAYIPALDGRAEGDSVCFDVCLPAAQELNLNPSLLTGFLEERFGAPAAEAAILRTALLKADRTSFC